MSVAHAAEMESIPSRQRSVPMTRPLLFKLLVAGAALTKPTVGTKAECAGYEESWAECVGPKGPICGDCTPIDCEFNDWGEWHSEGGCTGLVFRQRTIKQNNNECGKPCEGNKIDSKAHILPQCQAKPRPCILSNWTDWTVCSDDFDQSYRDRRVLQEPVHNGRPCEGEVKQTRSCGGDQSNVQDCTFKDWNEWTPCSSTCGTGTSTRHRAILQRASNGGTTCNGVTLESKVCDEKPCSNANCVLSVWSDWSTCDGTIHVQSYRQRTVQTPVSGAGLKCSGIVQDITGCTRPAKPNCTTSAWTDWSACDKTCDGGQKFRQRFLKGSPCTYVEAASLQETVPCNEGQCGQGPNDCELGMWGSWGECSSDCGEGTHSRFREVKTMASDGGTGCRGPLEEVIPCLNKGCTRHDCVWGQWEDWSGCTCTCDGGHRQRSRIVLTPPLNGGKLCMPHDKHEVQGCNTQPCPQDCTDGKWAAWSDWTLCSASCEGAYKSRRREILQDALDCGKPLVGEKEQFAQCEGLKPCIPDKDCVLAEWEEWSHCSCTCYGIRNRNRQIATYASGNGAKCEGMDLTEVEPCNPAVSEEPLAACGHVKPQDCALTAWTPWATCSRTCGGGQTFRSRRKSQASTPGGRPCKGLIHETVGCHEEPCEANVDCNPCVWGSWSEWSDCTRCGGQKYRNRHIVQLPNLCGVGSHRQGVCEKKVSQEVSNCPIDCHHSYCAWTDWSAASGCDQGCGAGKTGLRNRQLIASSNGTGGEFLFRASLHGKCGGNQLDLEACPNPKPCKGQDPIDCVFGEWGAWSAATCEGLCERSRTMLHPNNEFGNPCRGKLIDTKRCDAPCDKGVQDCKLGAWHSWNACSNLDGQKYRTRAIVQVPMKGGKGCEGPLSMTAGCGTHNVAKDCMLGQWSLWNPCSQTCGGGWQTRSRFIIVHAKNGGMPCDGSLKELGPCSMQSCEDAVVDCVLGSWNIWTNCDAATNQRTRGRVVVQQAENGGKACLGALKETDGCGAGVVNCRMSPWTTWDQCDKTCGGGQTHRHRQIAVFPTPGGTACQPELVETGGCNKDPCGVANCELSQWADWGVCTKSCETGEQTRVREVLKERNIGGLGCDDALTEIRPCILPKCPYTECVWNDWSPWGSCTCTCGGGTKTRNREIAQAPSIGAPACAAEDKEEMVPCNTQKCDVVTCEDGKWDTWTRWTECSRTCGGGTSYRIRKIAKMATECGRPVEGDSTEVKFCNTDSCTKPVDCLLAEWSEWSDCSETCQGLKWRSRRIQRYGRGKTGKYCEGALKETAQCNPVVGEPISPECEAGKKIDGEWGSWGDWTECNKQCGGGQKLRERDIAVYPANGGEAVVGALQMTHECARRSCPAPNRQDCQFGLWEDWGACSKCGGQRKRYRSIIQYEKNGGLNCEPFANEETGACDRECHRATYCTWANWQSWGPCTVLCGMGKKGRRRNLIVSDKPADPPISLYQMYKEQSNATMKRSATSVQELTAAFAVGCFMFFLVSASMRFCTSSQSLEASSSWRRPAERELFE